MAYIDTRKTPLDSWITEAVGATPAIDSTAVESVVRAGLPHDGKGNIVLDRVHRRHVDEILNRVQANRPELFHSPLPPNPILGRDWNELKEWERLYASALANRKLGI